MISFSSCAFVQKENPPKRGVVISVRTLSSVEFGDVIGSNLGRRMGGYPGFHPVHAQGDYEHGLDRADYLDCPVPTDPVLLPVLALGGFHFPH